MKQCFVNLLAVIILLPEHLSLKVTQSACSSQTEPCHNETLTLCHEKLPPKLSSNTTVTLCNGQIDIENNILVSDLTAIHLKSFGDGHTDLVCTHSAVGFKFDNVTDLHISSVVFDGCGLIISYKDLDNSTLSIRGGLVISHCRNVILNDVIVQNSVGSGVIINQTSGHVQITNSSFDGNCRNKSMLAVAGGLYVEFVHNHDTNWTSDLMTVTVYSIDECKFVNNNCSVPSFIDGIGTATRFAGFGQGGGVRLVFKYNASNNNITIKNSEFSNNSALWGGGIRVQYLNSEGSQKNNSIIAQNSQFVRNKSFYNGGGIDIGFAAYYSRTSRSTWNVAKFRQCIVEENEAGQYGGGVRISSSRNKFVAMNITFSECFLSKNKALYGPAIDMLPRSEDTYNEGYLSSISFDDCKFTSNSVTNKLTEYADGSMHSTFKYYESGKGVFTCVSFYLYISGRTIFKQNNGSAMHLISCKIKFESGSLVNFTGNRGYDGGAIVLLGASVLYVNDNSTLLFANNSAVRRGGAIMYFLNNEHDFIALKSCFIQYVGQNLNIVQQLVQFNFFDNRAAYGQAIFASTLRSCQRLCVQKQPENWTVSNHTSVEQSFGCIGNFTIMSKDAKKQVSTSGERLVSSSNSTGTIPVIPGQELSLEFNMSDELDQSAYDTFHVSVQDNIGGTITIDPAYTYVSERKVIKLYGKPGEKAEVVLTNAEFQPIVVIASVEMKHCPPGFVLAENTSCVCSAETQNKRYIGIMSCNLQKRRANLRSGYWVGYENMSEIEDELITGQCPRGFCKYNIRNSSSLLNKYTLPKDASVSELDTFICGKQRTGKLCGSCRSNHSVFFHSPNYMCNENDRTCKVSVLLYFVTELLPVTILFLIIIFLDIRFTSGSLNSLLFYVQIIDALVIEVKGIIQPHLAVDLMIKANRLLYGIFNLDFFSSDKLLGFSFCMWSTASTLDILALKYITITYSLALIMVTVILMKFCNPWIIRRLCPCNKNKQFSAKTSVIHGLVAFLVICYVQSTEVSLSILTPGEIHSIGSATTHNVSNVVYHNGDMPFMSKQHLKYAIPAIFFTITFTIIPPLLLIIYPLCYKVFALLRLQENSCVRVLCIVVPLEKLKPLFDSFQGCFKDEYRFFAGLFFIYRLLALINYAVTDSLTLFYTLLEVQLIIMLILHAIVQPYKQKWHNKIDIILLGLLALINAMTMYNYQNAFRDRRRYETEINVVSACQVFLVFLPPSYLVIYGAKRAMKRCACARAKREIQSLDQELTDTLTLVDRREKSYNESGYHRF